VLGRVPSVLADRQQFAVAARVEALLGKVSRDPGHRRRIAADLRLEAIARLATETTPRAAQEYPLFVMNRDLDRERMARFVDRCAKLGISFSRIPCVDAQEPNFEFQTYADFIPDLFWGSTSFNRGVVGNYLSHIRIWERIAERQYPFAIVCEDDAFPLVRLPSTQASFGFPPDFDLVFVNRRAADWVPAEKVAYEDKTSPLVYVPYQDVVTNLLSRHPRLEAPGAEGYAVSLRGAKKLLEIARRAGVCCGDDWAMSLHSLEASFREALAARLPLSQQQELASLHVSDVHLRTFVLFPGLIDHRDNGKSTIDRSGVASRVERSAMGILSGIE
jgi:GR25 family glycosyltransferase involved in LPS biosynthesis